MMMRWLGNWINRRFYRDCEDVLSVLASPGTMSSLDLWACVQRMSIGKVHIVLNQLEALRYIDSAREPGGYERGWRDRRIVTITPLGRLFLKELRSANGNLNEDAPPAGGNG
jgi:DNA-binding PadR family transcriptional regulator